jgi:hypothetical protein
LMDARRHILNEGQRRISRACLAHEDGVTCIAKQL